tara:strand:- start:16247 stop:18922 length:2676 start_codon:yes stop_codon:yes gene_type:complete
MVSFIEDSLESTTGNGKFLSQSHGIDCEKYTIDPPPHNQQYFFSQLKAIDSYFRAVSYNKMGLDLNGSTIYPIDGPSYELKNKMNYYYPYSNESLQELRLSLLFEESVLLAYKNDSINFDEFDLVVVAHAGIGQDFSLPFLDLTPEDIPSTFVDQKMISEHLNKQSIAVGNSFLSKGIIIPETQNHLLYEVSNDMFLQTSEPCDYQYGLTGTFALMVGFGIGLPPLWDLEGGKSGVGVFGLMDQGSNNGRGLIPSPPTAWTRIYAGWEDSFTSKYDTTIHLPARNSKSIFELTVNENESFLIENRTNYDKHSITIDSLRYGIWEYSNPKRYPPLVEVLFDSIEIEMDINGVVTSIPNYDLGLPASGLLIWHIDNSIISAGLDDFAINGNISKKGVDLEESDGAQDIGFPSIFLFSDPSTGYFGDMWFEGNEEYERANKQLSDGGVEFGTMTFPNTSSNNGSSSFLNIENISKAGDTMSFYISNNLVMNGFPDTNLYFQSAYDIDGDKVLEFFGGKDSLWYSNDPSLKNRKYFLTIKNKLFDIGFFNDNGHVLINVIEHGEDYTIVWHCHYSINEDSIFVSSVDSLDSIIYHVYSDPEEVPRLMLFDEWKEHLKKVYFSKSQIYRIYYPGQGISVTNFDDMKLGWHEKTFKNISGVDLNLDGGVNLLALDDYNILYAFNSELKLMPGFPVKEKTQAPILSRDIFGDEKPEIIAKSLDSKSLYIFNNVGQVQYKIATSQDDTLVALLPINGRNSIVTRSTIYQFEPSNQTAGNEWSYKNGNSGNTRQVSLEYSKQFSGLEILKNAYCYPNPIRNGKGTFRAELFNASSINIKLFDLAGYFVKEFSSDNLIPGFQIVEWEWEVDKIEPGIYFAQLSVKGKVSESTEIIKVAVIK